MAANQAQSPSGAGGQAPAMTTTDQSSTLMEDPDVWRP